jgi:hypothetical protein
MLRKSSLFVCVLAFSAIGVGVASANPYYLVDLAPLGADTVSAAYAINSVSGSPVTVGFSQTSGANRSPVVWNSHGVATSLLPMIPGASAGSGNMADAIDANGDIAGQTLFGGVQSAFYLPSGGTGTILPLLSGGTGPSSAAGVNSGGMVVGYTCLGSYYTGEISHSWVPCPHAFVWSASTGMVDLGEGDASTGVPTYATAISADGNTIIGDYGAAVGQQGRAVKWTKSGSTWTQSFLDPGSIYPQSVALAINNNGDIVGSHFPVGDPPPPNQYALLVKHDGTVVDLGDIGLQGAYARGINDSGVVVGYDWYNSFINYTASPGGNVALSTLISPVSGAGWTFSPYPGTSYAMGIDNNGEIAGRATSPTGTTHGYLLVPALPGDANEDAKVDINDLTKVLASYNGTGKLWGDGDFNNDGKVDINDLTIVLAHYNQTYASSAAGMAAVPEPSTVLLAVGGLMGLLAYAWRKQK